MAACGRRLFLCFVLPVSFSLALGLLTASHPFGAGRAVFGPVRLRLERGPTLAAAFHFIPVFDDFGVQGSVQWEDGCLKPPAQQRIENALYANTFLAIVQQQAITVTVITALMRQTPSLAVLRVIHSRYAHNSCVHSFPGFTRKMPSTFCLIWSLWPYAAQVSERAS